MSWLPYATWIATAAALGLAAIVGAYRGFGFNVGAETVLTTALLILLPLALALYGRVRSGLSALVTPCLCFAQFSAFNGAIILLQFPLASLNFPVIDPQLVAIDKALGGDWPTHFAWLTSSPLITGTMTGIYQSLLIQIPVLCAIVGVLDPKRLRIFVLANTIGLGATVAIATLLPAESALGYWGTPGFGSDPVNQFHAVRDGSLRMLDPGVLTGILTFPSYHTLLAILVALAFRGLPRVFPIVVAFQLAIVVTTRGVGGHYFADIAVGAALAFLANWMATALMRRYLHRSESSRTLVAAPLRP